jgi:murein DD-endopeptidase MepM/ murein hydrolase activator NlpD
VPHFAFAVGTLAVLFFFAIGSYGVYRSIVLQSELEEFHALKDKHLRQQIEVRKISNNVSQFKNQMDRLRELDYKLRLITDLEVERPSPSLYGIGGSLDINGNGLKNSADLSRMDLITMLDKDLVRLKEMANYQEESFNNLKAFLVDRKDLLERSPYRWPVRGFVSSNYGPRLDPFTGLQRRHVGVDIVAPKGTPVKAPADGIVTYTTLDPTLGNMVVIDHGYGVITRYGHNDSTLVREGQRVKRGDPIALVGSSGKSTGPHLHYEIRINDVAVNPLNYILE